MKKILAAALCMAVINTAMGQYTDTTAISAATKNGKRDWSKVSLAGRANDHLLIQVGYAGWAEAPDSLNIKGFSKSFNVYLMLDFPFKTDPRFSVAFGPGIGTDNIRFEKTRIGVADQTSTLRFQDLSDTNHFKKYRLVTAFLEAPIELRYSSNPLNNKKSFKVALGVKVGTLLDVHTKGKEWETRTGSTLNNYTEKIKSKTFFNKNRLAATMRVGRGNFSLYGTYQLGPLIKEGLGPQVKPFSIGLTLSGL